MRCPDDLPLTPEGQPACRGMTLAADPIGADPSIPQMMRDWRSYSLVVPLVLALATRAGGCFHLTTRSG